MFDPYLYKFTDGMIRWWLERGHEVKVDRYYDPKLIDWADVIWFETCDNNLKSATNPDEALIAEGLRDNNTVWRLQDHDLTGKKVIVRPIDIEVWQGQHAGCVWSPVTDCIFIAPHIRDMMMADSRPQESEMKIHTIPCAVDLDKFKFRTHKPGKHIAIVGEVWESKGVDLALQLMLKLKPLGYDFHWLGKFQDYHWDKAYMDNFINHNDLPVTFYDWVESVDEFLEDKNYLLSCSKKEAFGYNIAEAMAKGIKPVIHNFYGSNKLWPGLTWDSLDEAFLAITENNYDSESYLQYLKDHRYTLPQMMESFERVING